MQRCNTYKYMLRECCGHHERWDNIYFAARTQRSQGHQIAATDAADCLGSDSGAEFPIVVVPWVLLTARVLSWPSPKIRKAELEVYQESVRVGNGGGGWQCPRIPLNRRRHLPPTITHHVTLEPRIESLPQTSVVIAMCFELSECTSETSLYPS